ncbi:MAG: hypothetical protein Tsb0021_11970 [Chlamydiales bacterium]
MRENSNEQGNDWKRIVAVLFLGVVVGLGMVLYMIRTGPSGQYIVKNILLSPDTSEHLWYSDTNPKTGGKSRFVLDKIVLEYHPMSLAKKMEKVLDLPTYTILYNKIKNDVSIITPKGGWEGAREVPVGVLKILVKTESDAKYQAVEKVFQQVQFFADGNSYRIELHEDDIGEHWAYFKHQDVLKTVQNLVNGL